MDNNEQKLALIDIFERVFRDNLNIDDAIATSGLMGRTSFYAISQVQRDEIKNEIAEAMVTMRRERLEAIERLRADKEAEALRLVYDEIAKGIVVMANIVQTAASDFNRKAAFDSLVDLARHGLKPIKGGITINNTPPEEPPSRAIVPVQQPQYPYVDPNSLGPADEIAIILRRKPVESHGEVVEGKIVEQPNG